MANDLTAVAILKDKMSPVIKRINKNMRRQRRAFQNINRAATSVRTSLGSVAIVAGSAAGAGTLLANVLERIASRGDSVGKLSKQIGLSTQAIQEWRYAGERSGVTTNEMNKSMVAFTRRFALLKNQQGEMYSILNKTSPGFLKQLSAVEDNSKAFDMYVNALSKVDDQGKRVALADAAFSESGRRMAILAAEGEEGVKGLKQEFNDLGGAMSDDMIKQSEDYNDLIQNITTSLQGMANVFGSVLFPEVNKNLSAFIEWAKANKAVVSENVKRFAERVSASVKDLSEWISNLNKRMVESTGRADWFGDTLGDLVDTFVSVIKGVKWLTDKLGGLKGLLIIFGGVVGIQVVSSIATLIAAIGAISAPIWIAAGAIVFIIETVRRLINRWDELRAAMSNPFDFLNVILNTVHSILSDILSLIDDFIPALEPVTNAFNKMADLQSTVLGSIGNLWKNDGGSYVTKAAARRGVSNFNGEVVVKIDNEGRGRVDQVKSDNKDFNISTKTGLLMR